MSPSRWFSLPACFLMLVSVTRAVDEARPALDVHGDALPPGASARLGTVRLRHSAIGLSFAPDSKTFASAGGDHHIRIWEVSSGKELLRLEGHTHPVFAVVFSADGKTLVSSGMDGTLRVWDSASGKLSRTFSSGKPEQSATALVIAPDNQTLLAAERDGTVRVWDLTTGKERSVRSDHRAGAARVALCADGKHFATLGKTGGASVWEIATGKEIARLAGQRKDLSCLLFAPDGKSLATAGRKPAISLWDARTAQELRRFEAPVGLFHILAFSPNGRYLAAKGGDRELRLWGVASGKELRAIDLPLAGVGTLAFSPDGKVLVAGQGQSLHLWDLARNRALHEFPGHAGGIDDVRFSADGKRLTSGSRDRTGRLWDASTGKLLQTWTAPDTVAGPVRIAPDGSLLASGRTAVVRADLADGKVFARDLIAGLPSFLSCLAVSPDSKVLAARGRDRTICLYSMQTGKEIGRLEGDHDRYFHLDFTPDGKWIAGGGRDVPVIVWEAASGKEVRRFNVASKRGPFTTFGVGSLGFTPDGKGLLTVDGQAILWEVSTGRERWRAGGDPDVNFWKARFAPDGKAVAAGTYTGTVRILETGTGTEVGRFDGHRGAVTGLAFAPAGKTFASGSDDGTVLVWNGAAACKKAVPAPVRLKADQLAGLWQDLIAEDAAKAYRAIWSLAADARQAVPALQGRLLGGVKEDAERFARLLRKLDDKAFTVRESAQKELEQWEDLPRGLVNKEAASHPSAEVRTRLKRVIETRKEVDPAAERVRLLRAIEVLEHIGTMEARQALQAVTEGALEPWVKEEARASLGRIALRR